MSWVVDGVVYHAWNDYQRARAAHDARMARNQAESVGRRVDALRRQVARRERELSEVRGDVARQAALQELMRNDIAQLRRSQDMLEQMQRESEQRMQAQLQEVRADQRIMAEDIASLEDEQQRHREEVRQGFDRARAELQAGLAEVEQRISSAERRLQGAISEVAAAVEAERRLRLERLRNEAERAREQIGMVEERVAALSSRITALALDEDVMLIRSQLDRAAALLQMGETTQALAMAEDAFVQTGTLEQKAARRGAELEGARAAMISWLEDARGILAGDAVRRYFAREISRMEPVLARWESRARTGYDDYRRLEIMKVQDAELFRRMDQQLLFMEESAPAVRDMSGERKHQAEVLIDELVRLNGPLTQVETSFLDPEDRKSPMVMTCRFGRPTIKVTISLDGRMTLDGYGFDSNSDCSRRAEGIVAALAAQRGLDTPRVDAGNRGVPAARQGGITDDHFAELQRRLHQIETLS